MHITSPSMIVCSNVEALDLLHSIWFVLSKLCISLPYYGHFLFISTDLANPSLPAHFPFYLSIILALLPFLIHPVKVDGNFSSLIFSHSDVFSFLEIFKLIFFKKGKMEGRKKKLKSYLLFPLSYCQLTHLCIPLVHMRLSFLYPTSCK